MIRYCEEPVRRNRFGEPGLEDPVGRLKATYATLTR
ncbi:hypothetical protein OKW21_004968 [Catalinimonas alkaloidigena]|nr:hypothetical protein [Catalinimonas alkaloidigena]